MQQQLRARSGGGAMDNAGGPKGDGGGPIRLLLTGFGPFPGIPVNASGELVSALGQVMAAGRGASRIRRPVVRTAVLPTEWKSGPAELQRQIKAFAPDVAVHFGVASDATGFRLETLAANARNKLGDACGHVPRRRLISANAPPQLLSTFPADAICQRLVAMGLPVELSTDAGHYLCNAALFRSLSLARQGRGAAMSGFVHIPAALADPQSASSLQGFNWSRAVKGGLAIIEICLAHVRGPAGAEV